MKTITAEIKFTVRPATGRNPDKQALELIDPDGWRHGYIDTDKEAVAMVHDLVACGLGLTVEIDLDGQVQ